MVTGQNVSLIGRGGNTHAHTLTDKKIVGVSSQIADAVRVPPIIHIVSFLGNSGVLKV
jgi:hypothetical protein